MLLAKQERPVSVLDVSPAARADPVPREHRRSIDDPGLPELLDRRHPTAEESLVHQRLVLEDLPLHREERRLVEPEADVDEPASEERSEAPARGDDHADRANRSSLPVREEADVEEAGVERRPDEVRHSSPLEARIAEVQTAVVVVDALDRPPVRLDAARGVPV